MPRLCRISAIALSMLLAGLLFATDLAAQTDPAPSPEDEERIVRAQALYNRATELYRDKEYAEAIVFYERALELIKEPDIEYNIAKSYEKLAQYKKAITHYEGYLKLHREKRGSVAPDKADVEAIIRDLVRRSAPKLVKLTVETTPAGANIYLQSRDNLVGQTPFETELDPGAYDLIVTMDGHEDIEQRVLLKRGEPQKFTFKLQRRSDVGMLYVDSNIRGARIYVQGQVKGLTPYTEEILVRAGRRQVTLERDRYSSYDKLLDVAAGESYLVSGELHLEDPPYSWRGYVGWTLVGLGLAGIGGGVAIKYIGDEFDYFEDQPEFQDLQLYQGLAYGLGGAFVAMGTGLVIWEYARDAVDDDDLVPEEMRMHALPTPPVSLGVTPQGGVSLSGQMTF